MREGSVRHTCTLAYLRNSDTWNDYYTQCNPGGAAQRNPRAPIYAHFSLYIGRRLVSLRSMLNEREVFLFEGGEYMLPGVREGHKQTIRLNTAGSDETKEVELTTLSISPLLFSVSNFLSTQECEHLIAKARPSMEQSGVHVMGKERSTTKLDTALRTSTQAWLSSDKDDGIIAAIDRRVAALMSVPIDHQEQMQVVRYEPGQHYTHHHDFWDPREYANSAAEFHWGHFNRLATVLWYMSDGFLGGETVFPQAGRSEVLSLEPSQSYCDIGLSVKPEKGKAVIW